MSDNDTDIELADKELCASRQVLHALKGLTLAQRIRVVATVAIALDVDIGRELNTGAYTITPHSMPRAAR